jgi:hypothetical protein
MELQLTELLDGFLSWVWARHHKVLSWYIRPLFLLPFCYFAYKRSLAGIGITLLALATSMFWFPAPEKPSPAVIEMLAAEKEYLTGEWTLAKFFLALLVPISFTALALTFRTRSLLYSLAAINASIVFKIIAWTFVVSDATRALAHLPAAVLGLAVCDAVILGVMRRLRKEPASKPIRQAHQHATVPSGPRAYGAAHRLGFHVLVPVPRP